MSKIKKIDDFFKEFKNHRLYEHMEGGFELPKNQEELIKFFSPEEMKKRDRAALEIVETALAVILGRYGFFADILLKLRMLFTRGVRTMATDGRYLFINPDFTLFILKDFRKVVFVLCHEILHVSFFHFARQGERPHKKWNYATDYAINLLLDEDKVGETPKDLLLDQKYKGMSAEEIFDLITDDDMKQIEGFSGSDQEDEKNDSCPHCGGDPNQTPSDKDDKEKDKSDGSGDSCPHCGGELGKPGKGGVPTPSMGDLSKPASSHGEIYQPGQLDDVAKEAEGKEVNKEITKKYGGDPDVLNKKTPSDLEKEMKDTVRKAANKNRGTTPGGIQRAIDKEFEEKIDWKQKLRKFVNSVQKVVDTKLPNKRYLSQGRVLWTELEGEKSYDTAVIAVDTSGSIGGEELSEFGSEIKHLCKKNKIKKIIIVYCDATVYTDDIQKFSSNNFSISKMKPQGGGGTAFTPVFEWIDKNVSKRKLGFIVYFTDAFGDNEELNQRNDLSSKFGRKTIWVVKGNKSPNLKWGSVIDIE